LSNTAWWAQDLTKVEGLEQAVAANLEAIWTVGMKEALASLLTKQKEQLCRHIPF
jgi:tagaturonate reductase